MKNGNYASKIRANDNVEVEFQKILKEISLDTELENICLRGNGLTALQIKQLSQALSNHTELKYLDLSYNEIHTDAMPHLKNIIVEHPKLTRIALYFNGEGNDAHVYALIRGNTPELNKRLKNTDISLASNSIGDACLKEAKNVLSFASILTILDYNYVDDRVLAEKCREEAFTGLETTTHSSEALLFSSQEASASNRYPTREKKPIPRLTYDQYGKAVFS